MKPTTVTTYRLDTCIPGVKSWGAVPEESAMTAERAREVLTRFKRFPQYRLLLTETTVTTRRVNRKTF